MVALAAAVMLIRALWLAMLSTACGRAPTASGPPRCEQRCMHWHVHSQWNHLLGAPNPHPTTGELCTCIPEVWDASRYAP